MVLKTAFSSIHFLWRYLTFFPCFRLFSHQNVTFIWKKTLFYFTMKSHFVLTLYDNNKNSLKRSLGLYFIGVHVASLSVELMIHITSSFLRLRTWRCESWWWSTCWISQVPPAPPPISVTNYDLLIDCWRFYSVSAVYIIVGQSGFTLNYPEEITTKNKKTTFIVFFNTLLSSIKTSHASKLHLWLQCMMFSNEMNIYNVNKLCQLMNKPLVESALTVF